MSSAENDKSFNGFPPCGSTLCPMCDYDLRGLPTTYQCPECGFSYDEHAMMWEYPIEFHKKRSRRNFLIYSIGWIACVAIVLAALNDFIKVPPLIIGIVGAVMYLLPLLEVGIAIANAINWIRSRLSDRTSRSSFLFIGECGILRRNNVHFGEVNWTNVQKIVVIGPRLADITAKCSKLRGTGITTDDITFGRFLTDDYQAEDLIKLCAHYQNLKLSNFEIVAWPKYQERLKGILD